MNQVYDDDPHPGSGYDFSLFAGTSKYYSEYRLGYPAALFDALLQLGGLTDRDKVLDLGCGTGLVAFELAKRGVTVHGVDPDPSMIFEALKKCSELNYPNIRWQIGADTDILELGLSDISLCTMGASFHWMNREKLVEDLDHLIRPQGMIAVFSGGFDPQDTTREAVNLTIKQTIQEFLGP